MAGTPLTRYQRFVVLAVYLGLGFDWMDAFLFNFIAPLAITDLRDLAPTSPDRWAVIGSWTGILTGIMLLGWAIGGMYFGWLSDRIGRTRTVIWTIVLYSIGTAAQALAPSVTELAIFRFVAALGIGGEWAAGVTLVAETVPEDRRVGMGTLLATSGAVGTLIALVVTRLVTVESTLADQPDLAWRVVMGIGVVPALFALVVRRHLHEPSRWSAAVAAGRPRGRFRELFSPRLRRRTLGGLAIVTLSLVTTWAVMAFMPPLASQLAEEVSRGASRADALARRGNYMTLMILIFNVGGCLGIVCALPLAKRLGRRALFMLAFSALALAMYVAFAPAWSPVVRILLFGLVAFPCTALTSSFYYYLTELFPLEVRGSGTSFCMNAGRLVTMLGPATVGALAGAGVAVLHALTLAAIVPALGFVIVLLGVGNETQDQSLDDV